MMRILFAKSKEQDLHPPEVVAAHHFPDIGGNDPQVFGDERKWLKMIGQPGKKVVGRHPDPASVDRGLFFRRDLPKADQSAKMIDPDQVKKF